MHWYDWLFVAVMILLMFTPIDFFVIALPYRRRGQAISWNDVLRRLPVEGGYIVQPGPSRRFIWVSDEQCKLVRQIPGISHEALSYVGNVLDIAIDRQCGLLILKTPANYAKCLEQMGLSNRFVDRHRVLRECSGKNSATA